MDLDFALQWKIWMHQWRLPRSSSHRVWGTSNEARIGRPHFQWCYLHSPMSLLNDTLGHYTGMLNMTLGPGKCHCRKIRSKTELTTAWNNWVWINSIHFLEHGQLQHRVDLRRCSRIHCWWEHVLVRILKWCRAWRYLWNVLKSRAEIATINRVGPTFFANL